VNKYIHLKIKARKLRTEGWSLDDICNNFKLSKGTVFYWIKDLPLTRPAKKCTIAAVKAIKEKFKKLRDSAYEEGLNNIQELLKDNKFRDFIIIYLTEGYRRCRNSVSVSNSNPNIIKLSYYFIKKFARNKIDLQLQIHVDQNELNVKQYWANLLSVPVDIIAVSRKSNSGQLVGRKWRSQYGVLNIRVNDTYLRSKIQAWMDFIQNEWNIAA
jgi:hypothetical protein